MCRTQIQKSGISEDDTIIVGDDEDEKCRHLTVHPDQVQTTALVDGLKPCSQYIFRFDTGLDIMSF